LRTRVAGVDGTVLEKTLSELIYRFIWQSWGDLKNNNKGKNIEKKEREDVEEIEIAIFPGKRSRAHAMKGVSEWTKPGGREKIPPTKKEKLSPEEELSEKVKKRNLMGENNS